MTLFSQAEYKFQVIKECEDIPTDPFLLAADEIVPFFGTFCFRNSPRPCDCSISLIEL